MKISNLADVLFASGKRDFATIQACTCQCQLLSPPLGVSAFDAIEFLHQPDGDV